MHFHMGHVLGSIAHDLAVSARAAPNPAVGVQEPGAAAADAKKRCRVSMKAFGLS